MMRIKAAIVTFILLITSPTRLFTQAVPFLPEPDKDPFVGTWKANADKSWPKLNEIEASYVRVISRNGDDLVISSRIKERNSAGFSENHYTIRCDGLPHRVQCGGSFCTTSCTYKTANSTQGETVSADNKTLYWAREVSPDGRELRIYAYGDKARKKLKSLEVADRVK